LWGIKPNIQWNMENQEWVNFIDDLSNPMKSIHFKDNNREEWISLSSHTDWKEPIKKV